LPTNSEVVTMVEVGENEIMTKGGSRTLDILRFFCFTRLK